MTFRLTLATVLVLVALHAAIAQQAPAPDLKAAIDRLGDFDYTGRSNAARLLRRAPADVVVPLLVQTVKAHRDEYVRFRALVLLTGFNDRGTTDLMRGLLRDRNDRLREVAYSWFAVHPDPGTISVLLGALQTEQAEFVRPALIRALAALGTDTQVQRALMTEVGRGLDFFRSAVIEALGERRAAYAADTIAAIATIDGPLQDDAVMALGRIGPDRQLLPGLDSIPEPDDPPDVLELAHRAAWCLVEKDDTACSAHVEVLGRVLADPKAAAEAMRAAARGLSAVAADGNREALMWLVDVSAGSKAAEAEASLALGGAALRNPAHVIMWLAETSDATRTRAIERLTEGFQRLEEEFAEEQFFAAARSAYWKAAEGSAARTTIAALINKLEF